jgi:hypothetical protein
MTKKSKSLLFTGLLLPILAGILVELFTSISVLSFVLNVFRAIFNFFGITFSVPLWILILIFLLGVIVPIIISGRKKTPSLESSYTNDNIYGINWQWHYYSGDIFGLVPICPRCKYQPPIRRFDIGGFQAASEGTLIQCDHCGFKKQFDFPPEILEDRITREIHRKIRTGEYVRTTIHGGSS